MQHQIQTKSWLVYWSVLAVVSMMFAQHAEAGSLTPPGAPSSTMKTLDEVEARTPIHAADLPTTISQPGSYYLAENVHYTTVPDDENPVAAILIDSDDVTLDLNGFTLRGPGKESFGAVTGIQSSGKYRIQVMNGSVVDWSQNGIFISSSQGSNMQNVTSSNNGLHGIVVYGVSMSNCRAYDNGAIGIAGGDSNFTFCYSENNGTHGFQLERNCYLTNSSAISNDDTGIVVIGVGPSRGSRVEGNSVNRNDTGLSLGSNNIGFRNTADGNLTNDFSFGGTAVYGPVIDLRAGGVITSDNPWANIRY